MAHDRAPEPLSPGVLADERRMRAPAAVALGARSAADVAAAAGLSGEEAAGALHRLTAAGVVVPDPGLRVAVEALRTVAAAAQEPAPEDGAPHLRAFVRGGRLLGLPAQVGRRWDVLTSCRRPSGPGSTTARSRSTRCSRRGARAATWTTRRCGGTWSKSGLMSRGSGVYRLGTTAPPLSEGERLVRGIGLT